MRELLTTVLFYPVELVKSRLQASAHSFASSSYQYSGLVDGLLSILQKNGVQGLFVGIAPVVVRAGTSDFVAAFAGEALLQRFRLESLGFLQGLFWRTLGCGVSVLSTMPFESVAARSHLNLCWATYVLFMAMAIWLAAVAPSWAFQIPNMRWNLQRSLVLGAFLDLDLGLAEVAETCSDDPSPVALLQDRLSLEPYELPRHTKPSRQLNSGGESLQLRLLEAEVAQQREIIAQNAHMSQGTTLASKHAAGALIAGVILVILLLFAACMASSLGLGADTGGAFQYKRRISASDWLVALTLGTALVLAQLYAFYHTGLLSLPAGDYAFPLMVACGVVTFFGPVTFVSCLHCHSSFEHLDDELGHVTERFDRLERLVSAGFHKSLQEEQELLRSLRNSC
eukprot:s1458_g1.t1